MNEQVKAKEMKRSIDRVSGDREINPQLDHQYDRTGYIARADRVKAI
jgi:hypothetical protein